MSINLWEVAIDIRGKDKLFKGDEKYNEVRKCKKIPLH